jgi:hypothetical protein
VAPAADRVLDALPHATRACIDQQVTMTALDLHTTDDRKRKSAAKLRLV